MKNLIKCCVILTYILGVFTITAFAQHEHLKGVNNSTVVASSTSDPVATHGMLIFGQDIFYASHLPMFNSPHDYQGLFRLKLDEKSAQLFKKDQQNHPEYTTYTIRPEKFVLPDMVKTPRLFKADLFRGHFERGGTLIASVQILIEKVVLFKKFDPIAPREKALKYLIVGSGKERFAVHTISNKPDFDHIVQVKCDMLEGTEIVFPDCANEMPGVNGNAEQVIANKKKAEVTLLKQIYLEFGDLRIR